MSCLIRRSVMMMLFVGFIFWTGVAAAYQTQASSTPPDSTRSFFPESPNISQEPIGPMIFRTLLSLLIIVGVIYVAMYLLKRLPNRRRGGDIAIRIIGTKMLGPKKSIYMVEIEDRRLVLGVTDSSISMLTELEKLPEELRNAESDRRHDMTPGGRFRDILDGFVKKRGEDG